MWWGRWASSNRDREPLLAVLREQIDSGEITYVYLRNDRSEWRATLSDARTASSTPPHEEYPAYYPDGQVVDMWLRLNDFEPLELGWMERNLAFAGGRREGELIHYRGQNTVYRVKANERSGVKFETRAVSNSTQSSVSINKAVLRSSRLSPEAAAGTRTTSRRSLWLLTGFSALAGLLLTHCSLRTIRRSAKRPLLNGESSVPPTIHYRVLVLRSPAHFGTKQSRCSENQTLDLAAETQPSELRCSSRTPTRTAFSSPI